jgi:hypothetical protein
MFPFLCDSHNLPVRHNLLQALSRLKDLVDGPLWIDAMCINQSNEEEKMAQIQMMTDIYKKAERVIVSRMWAELLLTWNNNARSGSVRKSWRQSLPWNNCVV